MTELRILGLALLFFLTPRDFPQTTKSGPQEAGSTAPVVLDFESGKLAGWSPHRAAPYSIGVVTDIVRRGRYAARFEVRQGDYVASGHRAELRDISDLPAGTELWYGFSTYIPQDFPIKGNWCIIGQWWAPPDNGRENQARRSPPLAQRYSDGTWRVTLRVSQKETQRRNDGRQSVLLEIRDFSKGVWHDWIYRVKWSSGSDGIVEAWLNGAKVIDYRGPVGYKDRRAPYFKVGIYRDAVQETYVAYIDEYRRGHSYAEVDPAAKR